MYLAWYDPNIEASGTDYKGGLALMQEVFDNPPFPGADRGNWNLDIDSFLKQNPRQVLSNASGTTSWRSDNGRATWEVTQNTRLVQGTAPARRERHGARLGPLRRRVRRGPGEAHRDGACHRDNPGRDG